MKIPTIILSLLLTAAVHAQFNPYVRSHWTTNAVPNGGAFTNAVYGEFNGPLVTPSIITALTNSQIVGAATAHALTATNALTSQGTFAVTGTSTLTDRLTLNGDVVQGTGTNTGSITLDWSSTGNIVETTTSSTNFTTTASGSPAENTRRTLVMTNTHTGTITNTIFSYYDVDVAGAVTEQVLPPGVNFALLDRIGGQYVGQLIAPNRVFTLSPVSATNFYPDFAMPRNFIQMTNNVVLSAATHVTAGGWWTVTIRNDTAGVLYFTNSLGGESLLFGADTVTAVLTNGGTYVGAARGTGTAATDLIFVLTGVD